jgi:hypothetical protein
VSDATSAADAALKAVLLRQGAALDAVFLLGAPRTGSTVIYQAFAEVFQLPYFSNLTNDCYAEHPVVGLAIQRSVSVPVDWSSRFGKTSGAFQPSEGSAIMTRWFGGGHPSQVVSNTILEGREAELHATLRGASALFGRPLMIKNAWNCFRIEYLARSLPDARFVWIRRDVARAALSDLEARYVTKGSPDVWNSATPGNVAQLIARPPVEQVVENQWEFHVAIESGLETEARARYTIIWYEDFLKSPQAALEAGGEEIGLAPLGRVHSEARPGRGTRLVSSEEKAALYRYVENHKHRLSGLRRDSMST